MRNRQRPECPPRRVDAVRGTHIALVLPMDPIEALRRNRAQKSRRRGAESQGYCCEVTAEQVVIRLRREAGTLNIEKWFVQCDQADCQYSSRNEPPCPLHIGLFDASNKKRPVLLGRREDVVARPGSSTDHGDKSLAEGETTR